MKKITKIILFFSLMTMVLTNKSLAATENLYFFNNQIQYGEWAENLAESAQFQIEIKRERKIFRPHATFSHADLTDANAWTMILASIYTPNAGPRYIMMDNSHNTIAAGVAHTLEIDELDFAYLSFEYKISDYDFDYPNHPILKVHLCGVGNYVILENHDAVTHNLFLSENDGWQKIILPNPRSCQKNSRGLTVEMVKQSDKKMPTAIKIRNFSFADWQILPTDEVKIQSNNEEELILINQNWEEVARGKELQIASDDWQNDKIKVGVITDGEIVGHTELTSKLLKENLEKVKLKIEKIGRDDDDNLSAQVTYESEERLRTIEFGTSTNKTGLEKNWLGLERWESDYAANYNGINYVSLTDGWQTMHLPYTQDLDWNGGFYVGARAKDWHKRWSKLSNVFFCQNNSCSEVDSPTITVQLRQIYKNEAATKNEVKIVNAGKEEIILDGWKLSNQEAETVALAGTLSAEGELTVTVTAEWLKQSNGEIYLYDEIDVLQDSWTYTLLSPNYAWQKNFRTGEWKEIYVRN